VLALLAEVTRAQETATTVEVTCDVAMLTVEASAREAVVAWDSTAIRVKDVEDRATLAEREALERVSRAKVENAMALASSCEDAKGLAQKIALLEDELAAECQAWEVSEREHQEQSEEFTILQTWGSELCHAIGGAPLARHHLTKGMRLVDLRHPEMAGELNALRVVVSTTTESVLGHSPSDTFHMEVVSKLATKYQKMKDQCSRLGRPTARIYDLLLGSPPGQA
jgi:hypothetical protein